MTYINQTKPNRMRHNINHAQQIANGTATINLAQNLSLERKEKLVSCLLEESRINSIYFSSKKPRIINIDFNYGEVAFLDIESLLVKDYPEATILAD